MTVSTLLTDFGTTDYYVAAVKGVLLSRAPGARLVDVTHQVEPGNIDQATFLLSAAAPCFPAGTVHLAVVDPGVGSERRMLAVADGGHFFVAPDNGLLTPWLADGQVHSIERPDLYRAAPGHTFHGRDRFAPAAAFLLSGGRIEDLGPRVEDPVHSSALPPQRRQNELLGRIRHIDRYGNLVTDLPAAWLEDRFLEARVGGHGTDHLIRCYADLAGKEAGLLVGSLDTLELSLNGRSLAERWQVSIGTEVRISLRRI